jgi:hypothetical protein
MQYYDKLPDIDVEENAMKKWLQKCFGKLSQSGDRIRTLHLSEIIAALRANKIQNIMLTHPLRIQNIELILPNGK